MSSVASPRPARDRVDAEKRLISAAADMLGEIGPRALSVRAVAERAGVNHGLVHHYFGGKDGLLTAAMAFLVDEHARFAREQSRGNALPAPLALSGDQRYLRAVVRAVLDGEMELATMEIERGVSIPRGALQYAAAIQNMETPDVETKAMVTIGMALEMGWAALEPFLFAVTEVSDDEEELVRARVRELTRSVVAKYLR